MAEPKLTCATFLADYAPSPVVVSSAYAIPVVPDLVIAMNDFMRKLQKMKPWLIRKEKGKPVSEGEYLQTPEELDAYKTVQHVHQLHALLRCVSRLRGP